MIAFLVRTIRRPWLSCLAVAALSAGCGSGIYPVEGKVVWQDGSPAKELERSQVAFEMPGSNSRGEIQADGSFRLTTKEPDDGAPAGMHQVAIFEHRPNANAAGTLLVPAKLDLKYAGFESSGLQVEVKPGKNEVTLTVERARP